MQQIHALRAFVGARVFDGVQMREGCALLVAGERIQGVIPEADVPENVTRVPLSGGILSAGFIDLQINGAGGAFFTESPTQESLNTMTHALVRLGTTSYLPTVISADAASHERAQKAVDAQIHAGDTSVTGIHIEGPFFDVAKRGCHPAAAIREIAPDDVARLTAVSPGFRLITLAPEHVAPPTIEQMVAAGNCVAIGHTNASYEQAVEAIDAGATGFTHLHNAMSAVAGRSPNVVGAALDSQSTWCGIICDGHHVHAANIRIAVRAKGYENCVLVSDAMPPLGGAQKTFLLDGEPITERDGHLVNAAGNLAGSAISLADAVRLAHTWVGLPLEQVLPMATLNPARILGRDHEIGRLAVGTYADVVYLDNDVNVVNVMKRGAWIE